MKKETILWIIAIILTVASAYYQRITGPTYPIKGAVDFGGKKISYSLERSHLVSSDYTIKLNTQDPEIHGVLEFKRYKTMDAYTAIDMKFHDCTLFASLPKQPAAGKLQYRVKLTKAGKSIYLTEQPVIIRFRGDVPAYIIIPHIILIFLAMLYSTRTGLQAMFAGAELEKLTKYTLAFIVLGGMIFGPITQKYAFGAFWTGFPFGMDLTDNKTLIALISWIWAYYMLKKSAHRRGWVLFAAIVTLIIYLIPHSLMGSELDYNKIDKQKRSIKALSSIFPENGRQLK